MDFKYYQSLVDEAKKIVSKEMWLANYGYPIDCPHEPDELSIIFDVAHGDVKSLVARIGQMTAFSSTFRIPYRTVQDWRSGRTKMQEHTIRMVGYILITIAEEKGRV